MDTTIQLRIVAFMAIIMLLIGCGSATGIANQPVVNTPAEANGTIVIAGSSTVYPITKQIAANFTNAGSKATFDIQSIGTGAGFRAFCTNQDIDIVNASRAMTASEQTACAAIGRYPVPIQIGIDALAIVVPKQNTFVTRLSIEQLERIFSGSAATWADVDSRYPNEPIMLFSPGKDSGTFDYFVGTVFTGDSERIPASAVFSEDDTVLATGVATHANAIGYFGFAYYRKNAATLRAIPISRDTDRPAIPPSELTVRNKSYPFSRPLFLYTSAEVVQNKPQVSYFIQYYLETVADIIDGVGYFTADKPILDQGHYTLARLRTQRNQVAASTS